MVAALFSVAVAPIAVAAGAGSAATVAGSGLAAALGAGATATASGGIAVAVGAVSATATAASPIAVAVAPAVIDVTVFVCRLGAIAADAVPAAAPLIAAGSVGMVVLGADGDSWDCWRPVLRDFDSKEPRGRLLKDVAADPRVIEVRSKTQEGYWPQIWLKNKWQEEFRIDYVQLPEGEIAAHAVRVEPLYLLLTVIEIPITPGEEDNESSFLKISIKSPGMASATVGSGAPATSFDPNILPAWSFASKFSDFLSHFIGNLPFAIAVGSGSTAHSNGGGAVAVSDGEGATAAAVSNGGYAEAVAIGPGMECSATSNEGEIEIKRNEKLEDGTVKNDEFKHHY